MKYGVTWIKRRCAEVIFSCTHPEQVLMAQSYGLLFMKYLPDVASKHDLNRFIMDCCKTHLQQWIGGDNEA